MSCLWVWTRSHRRPPTPTCSPAGMPRAATTSLEPKMCRTTGAPEVEVPKKLPELGLD